MNYLMVLPRLTNKPGDFYFFPLGVIYVTASLKKAGKNVVTLNLNQTDRPDSDVISETIKEHEIDVVLTGALSASYNRVKDIILAAKNAKEDIITVVGGGLISSEPYVVIEGLGADIGVIGEGEITVCELADALEKNLDLAGVNGLIYREHSQLQLTKPRKEISDLSSLPWPDYEGFGFSDYLDTISRIPGYNRYVTMISSRSCPFDCTFCYHSSGKVYRQRSLDDFFLELDFMLSRFRIEHLSICDELFSLNRNRTRDFCERMKERTKRYGITFDVQLRVDHVDKELLGLLKSSGCHIISYGIESADPTVLKSMKKQTTVAQIENALRLTRDAHIEIQGSFIFGDIEETWETAINTLEWWKNHLEYQINLTHIRVFPGTHLYKYACERGIIKDKLKYLEENCPLVNVSRMSDVEYKALEEKILWYIKTYSYTPDAVELLGIEGSACAFSIVCGKCKRRSEQTCNPFSQNLTATRAFCPHCKQRMFIDDAVFNLLLENGFTRLFQDSRIVAVWGCGEIAQKLFEKSKCLRENHIFLIDKKIEKQGCCFWGHKVVSPSIIPAEKVNTIIIASVRYANEINNEIVDKYPGVDKIINLTDMATIYN